MYRSTPTTVLLTNQLMFPSGQQSSAILEKLQRERQSVDPFDQTEGEFSQCHFPLNSLSHPLISVSGSEP